MISIKKNINSYKYAYKGLLLFFKTENNARIHLLASILVLMLSFYLKISRNDWLWISLAIGLVWMAEAFNTAIEKLVDLVSPDFHPKAGNIKDLAAGAVLITAALAVIIGVLVFKDYLNCFRY